MLNDFFNLVDKKDSYSKSKSSGSKKKSKQKGKVKATMESWRDESTAPSVQRFSETPCSESGVQLEDPPQLPLVTNAGNGDVGRDETTPCLEPTLESTESKSREETPDSAMVLSYETSEALNITQESPVSDVDPLTSALTGEDHSKHLKVAFGKVAPGAYKPKGTSVWYYKILHVVCLPLHRYYMDYDLASC